MDKKKVFKELVERLSQSAYYYGVHQNEEWKKALINDRQAIVSFFKKEME